MKRLINIIWGVWCAFTTFLSPVWLTMIYLNITGMIYKYDYSMDEGTAIIMGIFLLALWLFSVLVPIIGFLRYAYMLNKKYLLACFFSMFVLMMVCMAICGWDVVHFLVS